MSLNFGFFFPTKVKFGAGVASAIGEELLAFGLKKVIVVTDQNIVKAGIVEPILEKIKAANIDYFVYDEVKQNPRDHDVNKGAKLAKENNAEGVVAIGGGSTIDTAKGIQVLLEYGGDIRQKEFPFEIKELKTPLIALPTTSGTGSEVTPFAIITDTDRNYKMGLYSPYIVPKVALVDPELSLSVPARVTASTGIDALVHAVEAYTCKLSNPITDAIAIRAVNIIANSLRDAVENGSDIEARSQMMLGSTMAGIAFGYSDVAGVHAMAEAVGGMYDTPHGIANAIFFPYVTEYNLSSDYKKHAELAAAMGVDTHNMDDKEAAYALVEELKKLNTDLHMPTLKEVGVLEEDFKELAKASEINIANAANPRECKAADYLELFKKAFSA